MARTVFSIWSWVVLGVLVLVWTPMVAVTRLVTMPFDRGAYAAGYLFRKITVVHQRLTPLWSFRTSGTLPANMRNPYVVVSNHESFVDILLISHLPTEMKWISKIEIMKIPLVGWMMRLARDIPLTRGDTDSGRQAIEDAHERLDRNVSVMIFPEGTRSKTGELRKFRAGAFKLAVDAQVPILPLAVYGTRDALRKNDWRLGNAVAEVRVLDPIPTEGLTTRDLPALRRQVRDVIIAARDDLRREFGDVDVPAAEDAAAGDDDSATAEAS
jgi:1-acyl-sn-glycerol-3-phosphate acyltransferase